MAATWQWAQQNGAAPGTPTDIGDTAGNFFNFKANDSATPSDYSSNPITAGNNSMEVYLRGHFTGTFNQISNMLFWNSVQSLTGYGSGASIKASIQSTYSTPTTTPNGDSAVPTSQGSALAVTPSTISSPGYSDFIRLQLATGANASPGDGGSNEFSFRYSES